MKNNLKVLTILAFVAAVPSLIITDRHYKRYVILVMFLLLTITRIKYPYSTESVEELSLFTVIIRNVVRHHNNFTFCHQKVNSRR